MESEELRAWLRTEGRSRLYRPNTYVFQQGDDATHVFLLAEGSVEIGSITSTGQRQLHSLLAPGDLFGELGVLGGLPRTATALVLEDSTILVTPGGDFLAFLDAHPTVARSVMGSLVRQLHEHEAQLEDVLFLDLRGRVAKRLLALTGEGPATPEVSPSDLASLAGGSRENVTRVLSDLQRSGYIERRGRRYVIKDAGRLRRLAGA
jgi:CRP/FNR family transcriptional regulator, cyclic AMP receptor protein